MVIIQTISLFLFISVPVVCTALWQQVGALTKSDAQKSAEIERLRADVDALNTRIDILRADLIRWTEP